MPPLGWRIDQYLPTSLWENRKNIQLYIPVYYGSVGGGLMSVPEDWEESPSYSNTVYTLAQGDYSISVSRKKYKKKPFGGPSYTDARRCVFKN